LIASGNDDFTVAWGWCPAGGFQERHRAAPLFDTTKVGSRLRNSKTQMITPSWLRGIHRDPRETFRGPMG
tara:strand:+ start:31235 stop:31444 length:210 start_codon:yes stop_codon:yes gene_type:complete